MTTKATRTLIIIAAIGTLAIIMLGLFYPTQTSSTDTSQAAHHMGGLHVGNIAPNFTLLTPNGKKISLSNYKGMPVMLNFWRVDCDGCQVEIPGMQRFYATQQTAHKDFVILGINVADDAQTTARFILQRGLTYPIVLDQSFTVSGQYNVSGTPTSYFIDRKGIIAVVELGPVVDARLQQDVALIHAY
jgi:peroxiredoxin